MIRPPGWSGAAFGTAAEGDARTHPGPRRTVAGRLGISTDWAVVRQVHGAKVIEATGPGMQGEADGMVTAVPMLPLAVATADCFPVVLAAPGAVGLAHAGWRGVAVGVVESTRLALEGLGQPTVRAAVGPGIGPCCFEVGPEVLAQFSGRAARTSWGSPSVDLPAAIEAALDGLEVWIAPECTMCGTGYRSYRRDRSSDRQVAVAWLPSD